MKAKIALSLCPCGLLDANFVPVAKTHRTLQALKMFLSLTDFCDV